VSRCRQLDDIVCLELVSACALSITMTTFYLFIHVCSALPIRAQCTIAFYVDGACDQLLHRFAAGSPFLPLRVPSSSSVYVRLEGVAGAPPVGGAALDAVRLSLVVAVSIPTIVVHYSLKSIVVVV
jgi:hypothetical protein